MALRFNGYSAVGANPWSAMCSNVIGTASGITVGTSLKPLWGGNGDRRSQTSVFGNLAATPDGVSHPASWNMAQKAGRISSRSAVITITPTATGGMGMPGEGAATISITTNTPQAYPIDDTPQIRTGSATISITTNTPDGQLITSGSGSASFAITTNTPLLTASINAAGEASFAITTNTPLLGAIADLTASATVSITTNTPQIYPLNDSSPLRTGDAYISITGSLTSYAVGHMTGTTDVTDVVTNASVARAVWDELLATHDITGSSGKALATASSGGVDPSLLAQAVWEYVTRSLTEGSPTAEENAAAVLAAAQVAPIHANIKQVNSVTVSGSGSAADPWGPV